MFKTHADEFCQYQSPQSQGFQGQFDNKTSKKSSQIQSINNNSNNFDNNNNKNYSSNNFDNNNNNNNNKNYSSRVEQPTFKKNYNQTQAKLKIKILKGLLKNNDLGKPFIVLQFHKHKLNNLGVYNRIVP